MNFKDYVKKSKRTELSDEQYLKSEKRMRALLAEEGGPHGVEELIQKKLKVIANEAEKLDKLKKLVFYGRGEEKLIHSDSKFFSERTKKKAAFTHAVVGMATELGEIIEAYLSDEPDEVNILEELGDMHWYEAIIYRLLSKNPEENLNLNIEKLKARFPDRFTEEAAENRDLDKERSVLEDGS